MNRFVLLLCVFALGGVGCACEERKSTPTGEHVSSAWAADVREAHQLADRAESQVQRRVAIDALRAALRTSPLSVSTKVRWVQQDLYFRLAQVLVDDNQLVDAETAIVAGLAFAAEPTVARANLLALRGKVYEAQGKAEQAAAALHDALLINEVLMERALTGEAEPERQ